MIAGMLLLIVSSTESGNPLMISGSSRISVQATPVRGDAPRTCHFEGAPREPVRTTTPGARPRNLLSDSSWSVVRPKPAPSGCFAAANPVRAAASGLARSDTGFLGPATSGVRPGKAWPGLEMTILRFTCNQIGEGPDFLTEAPL
jgi:hypothetical protein